MLIVTSKLQVVEIRQKFFGGQEGRLDTQDERGGDDSELEGEQVRLDRIDSNQNTPHPGSQIGALS